MNTSFLGLGAGEILWDIFPEGKKLGGAPANFAYHFNNLGGTGIPLSRIGTDTLGSEAQAELKKNGLQIDHITLDPSLPTGRVDINIDSQGVATYLFPPQVAWDHLDFSQSTDLAKKTDVICFGTLAQRNEASQSALYSLIDSSTQAVKIFDINLRQSFYNQDIITRSLTRAHILKINDEELTELCSMFEIAPPVPQAETPLLRELCNKFSLQYIILTRGENGSLIVSPTQASSLPTPKVTVIDTVGAGDSFTATFALGLLHKFPLGKIHQLATDVAAYVCTQAGAMPSMPERFSFAT